MKSADIDTFKFDFWNSKKKESRCFACFMKQINILFEKLENRDEKNQPNLVKYKFS